MRNRFFRIALVLLAAAVMLAAASCTKQSTRKKTIVIGVTLLTKSHPFYQEMEASLKEAAAKEGFELNIQSAEFKMDDQQAQIENFVTQQVDAIVVCPVDSKTVGGAIQRANDANIPVFTADIAAAEGKVVSHIASDNVAGGRVAGEYAAKLLKGKGKVIIIDHPKVTSVTDRTKGFMEAISKYPDIKVVARPSAEGERTTAMNVMENMLEAHPDVNAVFGINDASALGALAALRQAKRNDIIVIGYDGDPEARQEILKDSQLKADAVQYPRKIGTTAIEMVAKYLKGEKVPANVPVEVGVIDKAKLEAEKK